MMTLIKQESYKLMKKRSTLIISLFLVLSQIVMAVLSLKYPKYIGVKDLFTSNFNTHMWIVFFLIAAASAIVAMENQYGTLRALLYRQYTDWQVLVSKWVTIFIYSIYLYVMNMAVTLILKVTLFNQKFSLTSTASYSHRLLWQEWLMDNLSSFMTIWFLLSLVFLLATLFNSSSPAIITGIIGYFVLMSSDGLLFMAIQKVHWLKWNPINMLNAAGQMTDGTMSKVTLLNFPEILIGYFVYMIIFFALALFSFRRRVK